MKILLHLSFLFFLMPYTYAINTSQNASLLGFWKTMDDVSGQPKAIIQIEEGPDHSLLGRIVKIYAQSDARPKILCVHCLGDKKNKPLLGMIIMEHLKKSKENNNTWINGQIFNPNNGKNYHCHVQLMKSGKELTVKGYVGLPLFGRSQIWIKEDIQI